MGRKKYFCDYCFKSFHGDEKNRALHLNSIRHIQTRNEYYAAFKDPEEILREESQKQTCPYLERGCKFGSYCTNSHYHPEELRRIEFEVNERQRQLKRKLPEFSEWYRPQIQSSSTGNRMSHDLNIAETSTLPLSLQPFDIADYLSADFSQWGE